MKLFVTDHDGVDHQLIGEEGKSIMEIINAANVEIAAQCGGSCSCATCHVYVDTAWISLLPEPDEDEAAMLELAVDVEDRSRLSCQIRASSAIDGLRLQLAPGTRV